MNYSNKNLQNALAAEYVLGTLRGKARLRFKKLILGNHSIAQLVNLWEQKLTGINDDIASVEPDIRVWELIQSRLAFNATAANKVTDINIKKKNSAIWKPVAIAASLLVAVLVTSITIEQTDPEVNRVAVVVDDTNKPLWVVEYSKSDLIIRPTDKVDILAQNDYELWIVPESGQAPISLGILPQKGRLAIKAPASLVEEQFNILAVSLEPKGGSPTGQPSKVLFTAQVTTV